MTAYRIVVVIEDPMLNKEKYVSPRVFLFEPFKCDYEYEQEFISRCQLLFNISHPEYSDQLNVRAYYKSYEIYLVKDFCKRVLTSIKFWL